MSKRKKDPSALRLKLLSVILLLFSMIGLLGGLGFFMGKQVYTLFAAVMGKNLAWFGLIFCLVLAFLLWIYSSTSVFKQSALFSSARLSKESGKRRKMKSNQQNSDQLGESEFKTDFEPRGVPLPAGKLVSLQGFNRYFSSPEWLEMKDTDNQMAEEMEEVGKDFPSYFGTGESFFTKIPRKMTTLNGLGNYFEEVDQEEGLERENSWQDSSTLKEVPVIPEIPVRKSIFSPIFESQKDQEEFLAQFKDDRLSQDLVTLNPTIAEVEKNAQTLELDEKSIELPEIMTGRIEENGQETNVEFKEEPASVPDSKDELLNTESTFHANYEFEAPMAAATELPINYAGQVAPLVKLVVEKVEHWEVPEYNLLDPMPQRVIIQDTETSKLLEKVLLDFGVKAKVIRVTRGPVITRYELAPAPGVKISKIVNLSDDIALGLAARDVRIEAPIPGKAAIGIEVPNKQARSVPFREVLETDSFGQYPSKLKVALGKDIADQPIIADLIRMPHLLVAGATGSGKSVCITTIINSILYNATPDEVKFLLVDPKMVELNQYNGIPHLLAPVVVDPKKAASALKWIVKEMENRYELFAAAGVRDIERYNKLKADETARRTPALSFIVVIIDELADLMMVAAGEVEEAICRLAQMARAAGIHLVIATQRPSVDVITGVIKANIPSRISFAVSSQIDSRTILDATGAEKLLGRGDMLYSPLGVNKALRVQGCLVTDEEVQRVITHWKGLGKPEYLDPERLFADTSLKNEESNGPDDALFIEAGQLFIRTGMASVSFLQRRLKLGYARAARLMDMLEEQGVVGAYEGSKPRQVLLTLEEFNERFG